MPTSIADVCLEQAKLSPAELAEHQVETLLLLKVGLCAQLWLEAARVFVAEL